MPFVEAQKQSSRVTGRIFRVQQTLVVQKVFKKGAGAFKDHLVAGVSVLVAGRGRRQGMWEAVERHSLAGYTPDAERVLAGRHQ